MNSPTASLKLLAKRGLRRIGFDVIRTSPWIARGPCLRSLFAQYSVSCVIDVGANTGQYGRFLRRERYRGQIVSFEPVPSCFAALEKAIARDRLWTAHQLALGAANARVPINVSAATEFSSLLDHDLDHLRDFERASREVMKTEHVVMATLDNVFGSCVPSASRQRFCLKLDTQGSDLEVLKGAGDVLQHVSVLQIEVSMIPIYKGMPTFREAIEHIQSLGFDVVALFPVSRYRDLAVIEYDCIAARVTGHSSRQ